MAAKGECRRKRLPRQRNPIYVLVPFPEPLRSFHEASPPSITSSDMRIFAGIGNTKQRAKVRAKVHAFSHDKMLTVREVESLSGCDTIFSS